MLKNRKGLIHLQIKEPLYRNYSFFDSIIRIALNENDFEHVEGTRCFVHSMSGNTKEQLERERATAIILQ